MQALLGRRVTNQMFAPDPKTNFNTLDN